MQRGISSVPYGQGAPQSRTPFTKYKAVTGPKPTNVLYQQHVHRATCTAAAPTNAAQQQSQPYWHQQQLDTLWQQQQQQIVPGRSLHSQQTDELLLLLQSAQCVQQQQQQQQQQPSQTAPHRQQEISSNASHTAAGGVATDLASTSSSNGRVKHESRRSGLRTGHNAHQRQQQQLSDAALLVQMMKGCRNKQQLLSLIAAHVADVDAVAAAAAVLYYAKLVVPDTTAVAAAGGAGAVSPQQQPCSSSHRLPVLLQQLLLMHMPGFKARQYANTLYALGRMHCRGKPLVDRLLQGLLQQQQQWGLGQQQQQQQQQRGLHYQQQVQQNVPNQHSRPCAGSSSSDGWRNKRHRTLDHMSQLKPQELANIAWGLGRLRLWPSPAWMQRFYEVAAVVLQKQQQHKQSTTKQQQRQQVLLPQELANLIWGLGRLHASPPEPWLLLLLPAVEQQLIGFSPQQLSNMIWGLAQMGGPRPKQQQYDLSSSSSSKSAWCMPLPAGFLARAANVAQAELAGFSIDELANLVWGLAQLEKRQQPQQQRSLQGQQQRLPRPQQQQQQQQLLQLAEAACWQLVAGRPLTTAAAAAAGDVVGKQHNSIHHSSSGSSSDGSTGGGDPAGMLNRPSLPDRIQQARQLHHHYHSLQQQQEQQQQQQQQRRHTHVPPSQIARVLHSYRSLALLQSTRAAAAAAAAALSSQQQKQPGLPQPLLHKLAGQLLPFCPLGSSSTSSPRQHHRTLSNAETPGFCQTLLLLAQLGYNSSPRYLTAVLEVLHDKFHVLNPVDHEVVITLFDVLGYMPAESWVRDYVELVQQRFRQMRPEGLVRLLLWGLKADRWFSSRQGSPRSAAAAAGSNGAVVAAAAAMYQERVGMPNGITVRSGGVISASWITDLALQLRSKVSCRAAAAAAEPVLDQGPSAAAAAAEDGSSISSIMYSVERLDVWLLQVLQQHNKLLVDAQSSRRNSDSDSRTSSSSVGSTAAPAAAASAAAACPRHTYEDAHVRVYGQAPSAVAA